MDSINEISHVSSAETALLLIAHGSRQAEANADLFYLAKQIKKRGRYAIVEAAFLELAQPTIEEGALKCIAQGARCILLLPYFLSAGVHVQRDLTHWERTLSERFDGTEIRLGIPLGPHPLLVEILMERAQELEDDGSARRTNGDQSICRARS